MLIGQEPNSSQSSQGSGSNTENNQEGEGQGEGEELCKLWKHLMVVEMELTQAIPAQRE